MQKLVLTFVMNTIYNKDNLNRKQFKRGFNSFSNLIIKLHRNVVVVSILSSNRYMKKTSI